MSSKKLSLKDRAMAAVGGVAAPSSVVVGLTNSPEQVTKPKTGPGTLMAHLARESEVQRENDDLRSDLKTWDGVTPVRRLNPSQIIASRWSNRHHDSFTSAEFELLKKEIAEANGNIQPIKVRPIQTGENAGMFEIVFGHRRHRACLDLGKDVLSLIESIDDKTLFAEMDRENRLRSDLKPYEQGEMYRRALDEGLFSSMRKLADEVGADVGNVSKAVGIARLPVEVLDAFPRRLDIQYRWSTVLTRLCEKDADGIKVRAHDLVKAKASGSKLTAQEVFDRLCGVPEPEKIQKKDIVGADGRKAIWREARGKQIIEIDSMSLSSEGAQLIDAAIRRALG